jgi:hypothetical protein
LRSLHKLTEFIKDVIAFIGPGSITAIILIELVYWTSPQWAQTIHLPTKEGDHRAAITSCEKLLSREAAPAASIADNAGLPIAPHELTEWTLQRVEARFDSGLTVVSTLGPHGNLQSIVRDLDLPVGTTFRLFHGLVLPT